MVHPPTEPCMCSFSRASYDSGGALSPYCWKTRLAIWQIVILARMIIDANLISERGGNVVECMKDDQYHDDPRSNHPRLRADITPAVISIQRHAGQVVTLRCHSTCQILIRMRLFPSLS